MGIFVPTAYEYVVRKMKRQKCPQDTLSEAVKDPKMAISTIHMGRTERVYDYEMLVDLQKEYPEDDLERIKETRPYLAEHAGDIGSVGNDE